MVKRETYLKIHRRVIMRLAQMKKKKQNVIMWTITLLTLAVATVSTVLAVKYWMIMLSSIKINI